MHTWEFLSRVIPRSGYVEEKVMCISNLSGHWPIAFQRGSSTLHARPNYINILVYPPILRFLGFCQSDGCEADLRI